MAKANWRRVEVLNPVLDIWSVVRLWVSARQRRKDAERDYELYSAQLAQRMQDSGSNRLESPSGTITLSPYYRISIRSPEQAISWLAERHLLERVAQINVTKFSDDFQKRPQDYTGFEEFVEVNQHHRLLLKEGEVAATTSEAETRTTETLPSN